MSRVSNDIEREIAAAMRDCISENEAVLEQRAAAAGKSAVKCLKAVSRKRSGKYAKGWTSTVDHASLEQGVEVTVHNKQYQLTHLLEKAIACHFQGSYLLGYVDSERRFNEPFAV